MKHFWVLAALAVPLALVTVIAGGAHAQVGGGPDLEVTEVTTEPFPPTPGEEAQIVATVENSGDGDSNPFTYNFTLDGTSFGASQETDSGLSSGASTTLNATTTWTVATGTHTLGASVEHQDDFTTGEDSNPDNDELTESYTIGPDLAVTDVNADPADPLEGEEVTLTAQVENLADPDATSSDVSESFEVRFLVDGQQATTAVSVEGLSAGGSETVTRTWTPDEPGQRSLTAVADPNDAIADLDPSNDESDPATVDVRPALPDLRVANVDVSPDPVEPDRRATFTVEIANTGDADAGEHNVTLHVDGERVDSASVSTVGMDSRANATLSWIAEAGTHDLEIQVDPDDAVEESQEENNAWTLTLPVGPDLQVDDLTVQPTEPRANDRVRFSVQIDNEGLGVDEAFDVAFDVDGEPIDTQEVARVAADGSRNLTSSEWTATVGDHNVTVIVDPGGSIDEVDEDNNRVSRELTVGEPQPDLAVLSAGLNSSFVQDGDQVTVQAQVENAGPRDADAFDLEAAIDGQTVDEIRVGGLAADEAPRTFDLGNWTASEGNHELTIRADPDEEIEELSEGNNELVQALPIGTDLAIVDVSVDPAEPEPGEEVTALAIVENNGTVATPNTNASFELEGNELANATLDPLDPNEQASVEATFTASLSGTLDAIVDPEEALDELDEENNVGSVSLSVAGDAGPPDLTVRSVSIEDTDEEGTVRLVAEVANVGQGPSTRALVDFRADGSSIGAPVEVAGLSAGEATNVTANWSPTDSQHELEVVVDPDQQVDESDETNNAHTTSFEEGPVGVPLGPGVAAIAITAAAIALQAAWGSKRKPPKR